MINQEAFIKRVIESVLAQMAQPTWFIPKTDQMCHLSEWVRENANDHVRLVDDVEKADVLCLVSSSARIFAEVARGYGEHEQAQLVLNHLSLGKKVIVVEEGIPYRKYKETCPSKLYEKWLSNEAVLKTYGIEFVKSETLFHRSITKNISDLKASNPLVAADVSSFMVKERVITESQLSQIPQKNAQTITIQANAIVTPLAQDYIRQEHLVIKRASDRS